MIRHTLSETHNWVTPSVTANKCARDLMQLEKTIRFVLLYGRDSLILVSKKEHASKRYSEKDHVYL